MLVEIGGNLSAGTLFYVAVSELLARKNVASSDVADVLGLERSTVFLMYQMDGIHSSAFVNILNNSQAVTVDIDWKRVEDVVSKVVGLDEARIHKAQEHSEVTGINLAKKSNLKKLFERELYRSFSQYLMQALFSYNQISAVGAAKSSIPSEVMASLCQLRGNQFALVGHLLSLNSSVNLAVDERKLATALSSYRASSSANDAVIALIKAGANYHFVNTYNGMRQVDKEYFKSWRSVLVGGQSKKEKISVKLSHDIWSFYADQLKHEVSIYDIYMNMHRKFHLRIDSLYNEIQRIIKSEEEVDDDDFSDLKNCINS